MDQGGQRRDQVDATVMPDVRGQRRAAPASCARLQPRQFPAHAGDAGADQGLVADESEGKADQDRREGREPWPLCRLPDGRGRHPTANVPGDSAAHRGTAAAATTSASMRRSTVMRSRATDRRSASKCQGDGQIRPSTKRSGCLRVPVGVRTSRLSSRETGEALIFTPVRESSGECRYTAGRVKGRHAGAVGETVKLTLEAATQTSATYACSKGKLMLVKSVSLKPSDDQLPNV